MMELMFKQEISKFDKAIALVLLFGKMIMNLIKKRESIAIFL